MRLMRWLLPILVAVAPAASAALRAQQQQPFSERVEVSRVLIEVRVVDGRWRPIAGLEPSDFEVKIDGKAVRVESAEWIEGSSSADTAPPENARASTRDTPAGRLIVVLVQKSLEPVRIIGLMRMLQLVEPLMATLTPDDRVAVLSFDSHLKIWSDFTGDFTRVRSILVEDVLVKPPPPVSQSAGPSLMSLLDQQSGRKLHEIEDALRRIGEALEPLPGAKSIVLLGFGFGRFNPSTGGAMLMGNYDRASESLQRARATVFTLNVTQAHYNSLQLGLQAIAAQTGGFYASTYDFPKLALQHVVRALIGHYVLFVERPRLEKGEHTIGVQLSRRAGSGDVRFSRKEARVFARSSYVD